MAEEIKKMPVHSSHLALRFYKHDGWTKEILNEYLEKGQVLDVWADQEVRDYWFLDHTKGSRFDVDRLLKERVSKVHRWYDDGPDNLGRYKAETDAQYMRSMNW